MKIFITGNSRSGTTMMSRILGNHKDVFTFQELHFFDELLPSGPAEAVPSRNAAVKLYATLCSIQDDGYFGARNFRPYLAEAERALNYGSSISWLTLFEKFLESKAQQHHKSIPCEQTPQNIFALDEILGHFNDARVIIMIRDPREVLLSQKFKWKRRALSGGKIPLRESIRSRINYHPVTISKIWKSVMTTALNYKNHPAVIFVKYEQLIQDPVQTVKNICTHCEIAFSDSMLDIPVVGSSNFDDNNRKQGIDKSKLRQWEKGGLNDTEISICQKINGPLMQQLGYDIQPVDSNSIVSGWYSVSMPFRLGLALFFNLRRLKNVARAWKRFF